MTTAVIVGSTGLVGSNILSTITAHPSFTKLYAYARKELPISEKVSPLTASESSTWPSLYPSDASIFFSGLGTTRAAAGSFANQVKIDHDLNLALAKAAKEAGTKIYVLISSASASSTSMFGYTKMKGQLEDDVIALGFEQTVILRPGLIVGHRTESRAPEFALKKLAGFVGATLGNRAKDFWAQDAEVIAKAAVHAGLKCLQGEATEKVQVITQADIVRLGRTEWTS